MTQKNQLPITIPIPYSTIEAFCRKWQIIELALFGSALGNDFKPDSDIDVLVAFDSAAQWTLFDHVDMQAELEAMFNRSVDLVSRRGIERSRNSLRRQAILESAQVIYAAA